MSLEQTKQEYTPPGEVHVLTWGSSLYESTYWDPIRKLVTGKNAGHGAFVLDLPDTPENKKHFEQLIALGYPGNAIQVPKVVDTGRRDNEDNRIRQIVPNEFVTRYVVRFSPYFTSFGNVASDARFQKANREYQWDEGQFAALKTAQIIQMEDLSDVDVDDNIKKELLNQLDELTDEKALIKYFTAKQINKDTAETYAKKVNELLRSKYRNYFQNQFSDSFKEIPVKERKRRIELLVDQTMKNRQFSAFRKKEGNRFRGINTIIHLDRLKDPNAEFWQDNSEAAERFYQTSGQPPDRDVTIPLQQPPFEFGLKAENLVQEMISIKMQFNQNVYDFILKNESKYEKEERIKKEIALINVGKIHGLNLSDDATVKDYFNLYLLLLEKQSRLEQPDEALKNALNDFSDLWENLYRKASDDADFLQDAMHKFAFNCCRWTKDCVRAGLDSNYKGYLSEPIAIGTLTTPGELANEAATLQTAMLRDKQRAINSNRYDKPPLGSRIKNAFERLANNNMIPVLSRAIIRPVISVGRNIGNGISGAVTREKRESYKVGVGLSSEEKRSVEVSKETKTNKDIIKMVVQYKEGESDPFMLSNQLYQEVINRLKSNPQKLQEFKNKYSEIMQAAHKAIGQQPVEPSQSSKEQNTEEKRKKPVVYRANNEKSMFKEQRSQKPTVVDEVRLSELESPTTPPTTRKSK